MGVLTAITDDRNKVAWIRNLAVFGGETLKASRPIINELFDSGVNPKDFLRKEPFNESCLDDFYSIYKNERVIVFDTETTELEHIINPYKMFHKVYYDEDKKVSASKYKDKYVKLIVKNRTDSYKFDVFVDELYVLLETFSFFTLLPF